MSKHQEWFDQGQCNSWNMPVRKLYHRLPIIRHIVTLWSAWQVERWYAAVPGIRTGYDEWVLYGIWHNLSRPNGGSNHGE